MNAMTDDEERPKKLPPGCLVLIVTGILAFTWLLGVQPWRDARFRPYSEYQHEQSSQLLRMELSQAERKPWVGRYARKIDDQWQGLAIGSHHWNFEAGPRDFTYSYGTFEQRDSTIELTKQWTCDSLTDQITVIRWGQRHYVLLDGELDAFKQAVESGAEPRKATEGAFFMMDGDESKPVAGTPEILR